MLLTECGTDAKLWLARLPRHIYLNQPQVEAIFPQLSPFPHKHSHIRRFPFIRYLLSCAHPLRRIFRSGELHIELLGTIEKQPSILFLLSVSLLDSISSKGQSLRRMWRCYSMDFCTCGCWQVPGRLVARRLWKSYDTLPAWEAWVRGMNQKNTDSGCFDWLPSLALASLRNPYSLFRWSCQNNHQHVTKQETQECWWKALL